MKKFSRSLGNYAFTFEPPLDPRTDELDLVDAVSLQHLINKSLDMGEGYFDNPFVLMEREVTEAGVGTFLLTTIGKHVRGSDMDVHTQDYTEEVRINVMEGYLGDLTGRDVTVRYCSDMSTITQ